MEENQILETWDIHNRINLYLLDSYIDPQVSREKFENTLAHELHHIGYGSDCPSKKMAATIEKTFGRAKLIESMCNRRKLLAADNKAAVKSNRKTGESLALWSKEFTEKFK